jgi:ABC-2 type transport system ATP-binding protein
MIITSELSKTFGRLTAVNNVSIKVEKGQIHGLVGPDGAGKTTLIRMLCGISNPSSGKITMSKTTLGYMPQKFSLYGDLTVIENINFFGSLYGMKKAALLARAEEMLGLTSLSDFTLRLADNLSGGMKQKLALTCALLSKPELLILDEPTFGVDPEFRKDFWRILYKLNNEGLTVLVSTPYMDEAELCHKVTFMEAGNVIVSDSPGNLKRNFKYKVLDLYSLESDLIKILAGLDEVFDVEIFGDRYRLLVRDIPDINRLIYQKLTENSENAINLVPASPNMEDVFIGLAEKAVS